MKRLLSIAITFLLPLAIMAQSSVSSSSSTAEADYQKARNYYYGQNGVTKNLSEAFKWYMKAAEKGHLNSQVQVGYMYDLGEGITENNYEAVKWYRKAAERGNKTAQCNLGYMYESGEGVTKDYTEAVKWYRKAADQSFARAQCNLGYMYESGKGVTKDYTEAVKWYRKAAEQGYARAQCNLGYMYEYGNGVIIDYTEAVKWYRKSAEQGNNGAQNNLGTMYHSGRGVTKDYAQAMNWYKKAADQGNANAMRNIGVLYQNGFGVTKDLREAESWFKKALEKNPNYEDAKTRLANVQRELTGSKGNSIAQSTSSTADADYQKARNYYLGQNGVTKNIPEAFKWYLKAAEKGHLGSQNQVGYMYSMGEGITKNDYEAVKWYRKAAESGNKIAQCNLGHKYEMGQGITKDYTEAVKWYRKAAEQGYASGQYNLGYMYEIGKGVTKDYSEAVKWYRKAADQGDASAQNNLGNRYYNGEGVTKDYSTALYWYHKAADQGDEYAMRNIGNAYRFGNGVTKDLKEAESWYKKALEKDPNYENAKNSLAAVQKEIAEQGGTLVAQNTTKSYTPQNTTKSTNPQTTTQVKREVPILDIVPGTLAFIDPSGNNAVRASGSYKIRFQLQNTGKGVGKNCKVKVSATGTTSGVTYNDLALNTINPGSTTTVEIPVTSNVNTQNGQMEFSIQVDEPNGFGTDPQYITVNTRAFEAPLVQVTDYSLTAASGLTLKKKQPFDLQLLVQNTQTGQADNVSVEVDLPENVMLIDGKEKEIFSQLTAGETKSLVYGLIVNNNYSSTTVPIRVRLKEKYGKYAEDRTINLMLDQQLASTKLSVDEKRQNMPSQSITIARLGSDVDKELPISKIQHDKTFALIIANEHYKRVAPVPYAINDGRTFEAYCRQTLGIPSQNIRTLTDATLGDMKFQIEWLKKTMMAHGEQASVIFYYAGHGIPNESNKTPYLLPIDSYGSDTSTAYELKELYDNLSTYPARSVTVFLDACFSGAKREGDTREESMQQDEMLTSARKIAIKVNSQRPKGNVVVFSAAQGDETAYPYRDQQHGMFTYFLLKKLKETEGNTTLGELYRYIRENVMQQSIVRNNKMQTPDILPSDDISSQWESMMLR